MGLYNRFCKRFFADVIIRLTAQSDSRAPPYRGTREHEAGFQEVENLGSLDGETAFDTACESQVFFRKLHRNITSLRAMKPCFSTLNEAFKQKLRGSLEAG